MRDLPWKGRGQGHMSNFYIVDLENFATASRWYTDDIHNSTVVGLFMTPIGQWKRLDRVTVECTCLPDFITASTSLPMFKRHLKTVLLAKSYWTLAVSDDTVTLQLHNFDLFTTCRTSSFCTVAWQLARFQLTRRIALSLGDSWASCCMRERWWYNKCTDLLNEMPQPWSTVGSPVSSEGLAVSPSAQRALGGYS